MNIPAEKFKELLVPPGHLTEEQFSSALEFSRQEKIDLYETLLQKDLIADGNLGQLMSQALAVPFVNLKETAIPNEVLKIIPEIVAKKQKIIAFERGKEGLKVAMADSKNLEIKEFIEKKVGDEVIPYFATERDIKNALGLYKKEIGEEFADIISTAQEETKKTGEAVDPVRKIVETIIEYAYQNRASDIHIEPHDEDSVVRFRVDGVLHDVATISKAIHPQVVTLIKVMARLRTDEHLAAQDGKIQYEIQK